MGFLKFLKKEESSKEIPSVNKAEPQPISKLPPLHSDVDMKFDMGLPPLPELKPEEKLKLAPKEAIPDDVPNLDGDIPPPPESIQKKGKLPVMDEAPEFPSLDDYMEKEGIKEDIPPLEMQEPLEVPDFQKQVIKEVPQKPIFLTLGRYKTMLKTITETDIVMEDSINTLLRMIDVKIPLDSEYGKLSELLDDIQRKMLYVDQLFFKPE